MLDTTTAPWRSCWWISWGAEQPRLRLPADDDKQTTTLHYLVTAFGVPFTPSAPLLDVEAAV